jgi:predicted aspartyl protease
MPIAYQRGSFFITCRVNTASATFDHAFMVHTGHSGALIFGTRAVNERSSLSELRTEGAEVLKDSFGHELQNERVHLPAVDIGSYTLVDVPASLMDPRSSIPSSVIGGELLKRFNWLLDLRNDVLYLRPSNAFGAELH